MAELETTTINELTEKTTLETTDALIIETNGNVNKKVYLTQAQLDAINSGINNNYLANFTATLESRDNQAFFVGHIQKDNVSYTRYRRLYKLSGTVAYSNYTSVGINIPSGASFWSVKIIHQHNNQFYFLWSGTECKLAQDLSQGGIDVTDFFAEVEYIVAD